MPRVYVAGSINMDLVARAPRHPQPGETIAGTQAATYPGGKGANQAVAAAKLGGETMLVGKVGTDAFGDQLCAFLRGQGVGLEYVQRSADAATGVALIVVSDSGENAIVVVPGANALLDPADVDRVPIASGDVVLSQFEIPLATVEHFFRRARGRGATTILNPTPARVCPRDLLALADVVVLNELELACLLTSAPLAAASVDAIAEAARRLRTYAEQVIVVTLGAGGAVAVAPDRQLEIPGHKVTAVDTTGAGDTFVGATAACLACGWPLERALGYANMAAAICVQRPGAGPSIPTAAEVAAFASTRL